MSMIDENSNPHRVVNGFYDLTYWRDNAACGRDDANVVRLEMRFGPYTYGMNFGTPGQLAELSQLESMLARAYVLGGNAARAQIREAMGVQDPRR